MKNKLPSRITAIVSAAAIMLCNVSCKEKKEEAPKASELINNSYRSIDIDCNIDVQNVEQMMYIEEEDKIFISGVNYDEETGDSSNIFYIADTEFTDVQKLDLDIAAPENGYLNISTTIGAGKIYALALATDYGDFKLPDYNSPDFDPEKFDYEAMEKAAKYSYSLYSFDTDGNQLSVTDIDTSSVADEADGMGGEIYIGRITSCGSDKFIVEVQGMDQSYYLMDSNGTFSEKLELDGFNWINGIAVAADGNIAVTGAGEGGMEIRFADPSTLETVGEPVKLDNFNGSNAMIKGIGDYSLYMSSSTALCGLKDGSMEEIVNWVNSDINGDYVNSIIALENGDFIVYINDWQANSNSFCRLTKRDSSELENTKVITIAVLYPDTILTAKVTEFNKSSNEYRFRINDYSQYYAYDSETEKATNTPANQLKMDIVAGKGPDMVYCSDYSLISSLAPKGTFADLYQFLDSDSSSLSRDDIMPNVLKACEMDGKLVSISNFFGVSTWAAKKKYVDKDNWTLDEMIEIYDSLSSKMDFTTNCSKETAFAMLSFADEFVDYKNGTCSFDSPEFIKILEFCNRFPKQDDLINWETATEEEMQKYWESQENATRNDKCLISEVYLNELRTYARVKEADFGEDISLVGAPSSNGTGSMIQLHANFAILESSPSKEACWQLISEFFSEDYYSNNKWELPTRVSEFEKMADDAMSRPYWLDENGQKQEYDDTYYINDKEFIIDPLTKEERDYIVDFVKSITTIRNYYSFDIDQIINEEVQAFFNGEKTAEETAKMIQNRASIVVSEQS
jgi:extracellular solute-binding protein family 1